MKKPSFSFAVFAAIVLASIALGVLNNFRVEGLKRVPLAGYPDAEEMDDDEDA